MFLEIKGNEIWKWQSCVWVLSQQRDAGIGIWKIGTKEYTAGGEHYVLPGPGKVSHTNSVAYHAPHIWVTQEMTAHFIYLLFH